MSVCQVPVNFHTAEGALAPEGPCTMGQEGTSMAKSPIEGGPVRRRTGELSVIKVTKTGTKGRGKSRGEMAEERFVTMPVLGDEVKK